MTLKNFRLLEIIVYGRTIRFTVCLYKNNVVNKESEQAAHQQPYSTTVCPISTDCLIQQ